MNFFRFDSAQALRKFGSTTFDRSRPLAFMHIPKTSGTSIVHGVTAALSPAVVVGGETFKAIDERIHRDIYHSPQYIPNANLVAGHFPFSTLLRVYPLAQYLTILREPLSRLLSHWLYFRQHTDADLGTWGEWGNRVKLARKPLADFLNETSLAFQTDNLVVRMLLWPNPFVPDDQFIDPINDGALLRQAMVRLRKFDFVDIVEDRASVRRLRRWLGYRFTYRRLNETAAIPRQFRSSLQSELTAEAYECLYARSRLDLRIWSEVAANQLQDLDVCKLREQTLSANIARYSVLMAC